MTRVDLKSAKGKEAGWFDTVTKVYSSQRRPEHYMRMYQGFGISEDILEQLTNLGGEKVCLIYTGKKHKYHYTCELSQFLKSDKIYMNIENGFKDPQRFVSTRDMKEEIIG
jgi:hypothetical protein